MTSEHKNALVPVPHARQVVRHVRVRQDIAADQPEFRSDIRDLARSPRRFGFAGNGEAGGSGGSSGGRQAVAARRFRSSYMIVEPSSPWSAPALLCLVVTGWAAALRGYHLGMAPAWHDEPAVQALGNASLWHLVSLHPLIHAYPPLFSLIYGVWIHVLRMTAMAQHANDVRMLSVMIGALTVPFFFVMFRRRFGERVALLGATFLATSPAHLTFSQNTGPEALGLFLLVAALGFTTRLLDRMEAYCENEGYASGLWQDGTIRTLAAGYALSTILLGLADNLGFAVLLFSSTLVLVDLAGGKLPIATTARIWAALNLMIAVVLFPLLWLLLAHSSAGHDWASNIGARPAFTRVLLPLIDAAGAPGAQVPTFLVLASMMIAETLLVIGCYQVPSGGSRRAGILIGFLVALGLVLACGQWPPVLVAAAPSIFALPFFALLAGFALDMPFLDRNSHTVVTFSLLLLGVLMRVA